uniref:Uncharacterized protein n=1 Tax=Glossina pallidipes TaxID=7398 RepID=A0A1B0AJN2_GLOPL
MLCRSLSLDIKRYDKYEIDLHPICGKSLCVVIDAYTDITTWLNGLQQTNIEKLLIKRLPQAIKEHQPFHKVIDAPRYTNSLSVQSTFLESNQKYSNQRLFVCIVIKTSTVWDGDVLEQTMLDMHESIIINKKECANKQISISWPFFKHGLQISQKSNILSRDEYGKLDLSKREYQKKAVYVKISAYIPSTTKEEERSAGKDLSLICDTIMYANEIRVVQHR